MRRGSKNNAPLEIQAEAANQSLTWVESRATGVEESTRLAGKVRDTGGSLFAVKGCRAAQPPSGAQEGANLAEGALAKGFPVTPPLRELGGQWTKSMVRVWCVEWVGVGRRGLSLPHAAHRRR